MGLNLPIHISNLIAFTYYCFYEIELVPNETQKNEYLVEEYQVTQCTINTLSISVKRFYKSVSSIYLFIYHSVIVGLWYPSVRSTIRLTSVA